MTSRRHWKEWMAILLALLLFAIDQISKLLVVQNIAPPAGTGQFNVIGDFLRFTFVTNSGASFGMFQDRTMIFAAISVLAVPAILIAQRYLPIDGWPAWISMSLLLGGNLGNMLDRIRLGYVVDFIDVGIGNLRWYVFNVADATFVIGVLVLGAYLLFFTEEPKKNDAT